MAVKSFNAMSVLRSFLLCALTVAIAGASSPAIAGPARPRLKHAPIKVYRDENGDPLRTIDDALVNQIWSGYALPEFETGNLYTSAQATWTVPAVSYEGVEALSASWVGIGGFCENSGCDPVDQTLIQLGTAQAALTAKKTEYWAWYEMLPKASIPTKLKVKPGDVITASLSCAGACTGKQKWTLSMTNETTGKSWHKHVTYKSPKLSAEWIEEAPSSRGGVFPLADFGTATFTQSMANAVSADLSTGDSLIMEDPNGQSSNVSAPNLTEDGFNACFSPDSTLAACDSP